jgi:hypothetical protein
MSPERFPRPNDDEPDDPREKGSEEEHSMDEFPEGFEHFQFRARADVAEALRKMTVPSED